MMEKMARFRCSASTSLNWGRGASISHFILSKIVVTREQASGRVTRNPQQLNTVSLYSEQPLVSGSFRTELSAFGIVGKDLKNHGAWDIQVLDSYLLIFS